MSVLAGVGGRAPISSVIHWTDTHYNWGGPGAYGMASATAWMLQYMTQQRVAAVLHTGDLALDGTSGQSTEAVAFLASLQAISPIDIVSGNHDYSDTLRASAMTTYMPQSMFSHIAGATGAWRSSKTEEGFFHIANIGGVNWLIIGLEWSPRDAAVAWADTILKANSSTPAIVLTHANLYNDGHLYDWDTYAAAQSYSPVSYAFTPAEGINDGARLLSKAFSGQPLGLVNGNSNVKLVLSGHDIVGTTQSHTTTTRNDGTICHHVLANYQSSPPYGLFRQIFFDYGNSQFLFRTIASVPYWGYDLSNTPAENDFTLPMFLGAHV